MLRESFHYVAVDFETTGLDIQKEEPIQVGIVKCDAQANVCDAYVSYIKPTKDIKDLKQVVTLITGLSLSDVIDAPDREYVYQQIQQYIAPNDILIGHNISFDYAFLKKYRPNCSIAGTIDTYTLAQAMMHYQKSYALESLTQNIYHDPTYQIYYQKIKQQVAKLSHMKAHDALYDCVQANALFFYIVDRIKQLQDSYPGLSQCLFKSEGLFRDILTGGKHSPAPISFPLMERLVKPNVSPAKANHYAQLDTSHSKVYVGHSTFKNFLADVAQHNVLIAFSHRSKLDIAKNILQDLGHTKIGFLRDEQFIDQRQFDLRLNKPSMTASEFLFCCKYLSQHQKGYGIIDAKTLEDRAIIHTIQKKLTFQPQQIVLATHGGLYALMENKLSIDTQWLEDYTIVYADVEWRYTSYNKYANNAFDPYHILDWIDTLSYKYAIRAQTRGEVVHKQADKKLQQLSASYCIWLALWSHEVGELFVGRGDAMLVHAPMIDTLNHYRSSKVWHNVVSYIQELLPLLTSIEATRLSSMVDHLGNLLDTMVKLQRKLSYGHVCYTIAHEVSFTDFSELLALFDGHDHLLVSNTATAYHQLALTNDDSTSNTDRKLFPIQRISGVNSLLSHAKKREADHDHDPIYFVVSTRKSMSKDLLDKLYKQGMHKRYDLLVENITGGIGKLVMKAKKPGPKIIIGGYHFLLQLFSQKQMIDFCFVLSIVGSLKDQILADITWYGSQ